MTNWEAMEKRHSVRSYTNKKIEGAVLEQLAATVAACNAESGMNIQLCLDEPEAFTGGMAKYGRFVNVKNYIALVGPKGADLEEKSGYYGEKIVLEAQRLGLNTCWVAMTYSKKNSTAKVGKNEKLLMVIALGYGENEGVQHKNKPMEDLHKADANMPEWFCNGVKAAQMAPTAINQQKFCFILEGNAVKATAGRGFYVKTDLGIAKYHFELGAEGADWHWAE